MLNNLVMNSIDLKCTKCQILCLSTDKQCKLKKITNYYKKRTPNSQNYLTLCEDCYLQR